jgi:hypothetical protein
MPNRAVIDHRGVEIELYVLLTEPRRPTFRCQQRINPTRSVGAAGGGETTLSTVAMI